MSLLRPSLPLGATLLVLAAAARSQNVAAYHDASGATHQAQYNALRNNGYRMISLSIYGTSANPLYAAVWVQRAGPGIVAFHGLTTAEYQAVIDDNNPGYAPKILTASGAGNDARFAGVLEQVGHACWERHGLTLTQLGDECATAREANWRVATLDVYGTAGDPRYVVSYEPNPEKIGWGLYFANGVAGHQTLFAAMSQSFARPLTAAFNDDSSRFVTSWEDTDVGPGFAHHDMTASEYQQKFDEYRQDPLNYYPVNVSASGSGNGRRFSAVWAATDLPKPRQWSTTGVAVPSLAAFDTWMQTFMQGGAVRSAALAIVKDSKLVLARGYTWAESGYPQTQPTSLFRIASCSKPLTSIAVHRRIAQTPGAINYGRLMAGYFNNPVMADPRSNNIDIEHLLTHSGGWDRDISFDPMFRDVTISNSLNIALPITANNVRTYMQGQLLDFTPGTQFQYSNYGFSLLGRILERITPNQSYAQIVQGGIFAPLGVTRPRIGRTHRDERLPGEVLYHPRGLGVAQSVNDVDRPWVAGQYGAWNLPNMDSHGAWVMAAPDFAKVLGAFDLGVQNPILGQAQTSAMWSPPQGATTTLKGWFRNSVPDGNGGTLDMREHNGSLAGTKTYIGRREDGLSFVVFTNGDEALGGTQGQQLSDIANDVRGWPTHDLFPAVGLPSFHRIDDLMSPFGSSCPGSAGTSRLVGSGSAQIGERADLDLSVAPPRTPVFALLGGVAMAIDLGFLGAPGCALRTDPVLTLGAFTDGSGAASTGLTLPLDSNLIGAHLFAQYAIVDAAANRFGLTTTNGLDIRIGGWLGN